MVFFRRVIASSNFDFLSYLCPIYFLLLSKLRLKVLYLMSGENGRPCLIPNFSGNALSLPSFCLRLAIGVLYLVSITLRCLFYP